MPVMTTATFGFFGQSTKMGPFSLIGSKGTPLCLPVRSFGRDLDACAASGPIGAR